MSKRNAPKISCPRCEHGVSKVIARGIPQPSGEFYRRNRRCQHCGCEFETREAIYTVKKDATSSALRRSA